MTITEIKQIIEEAEYDHYGIRVHRGDVPVVGQALANSHVWDDGECTDEELNGVCALQVTADNLEEILEAAKIYAWDNEPVILVGSYMSEYGYDDGEIIMSDNACLAIIN